YSWRPPALVARFLARLPGGDGIPAAVFTADGGGSYGSADVAGRMLRRKGYRVVLKGAAHYPVNWVEMMPPPVDKERSRAVAAGDAGVDAFVRALLDGTTLEQERSGIDGLLNFVGIMFGAFGRHFLGKLFIADDDCTSCGLCARTCPAGAIVLGKGPTARPRWTWGCESCNRCMNTCPTRAINTSPVRGIALLALSALAAVLGFRLYGPVSAILRGGLPPAAVALADIAAGLLIVAAGPLLALTVLDAAVLRPLLNIHVLRSLACKSFTKGFPRYLVEGFKPPSER
ncbi:MAG: 4Fe-4S binding protein, partial [Treponema sp.]|nr:4Fe-4S binding protein [Treponema sp.]